MPKLSNDFYKAADACKSLSSVQLLFEAVEEYKDALLQELVLQDDTEKVLRLQGGIRTMLEILEGFDAADEFKRRIDARISEGSGPSPKTIT